MRDGARVPHWTRNRLNARVTSSTRSRLHAPLPFRLSVSASAKLGLLLIFVLASPARAEQTDAVVARVNQHEIRLSDVNASVSSLVLGDQIDVREDLQGYIEAMIREEVLFQFALATDFDEERELRERVKALVAAHLLQKHVQSRSTVPDSEVRAFYDANPSQVRGEHVQVREILLSSRKECEEMQQRVDSEETFIELARTHSLDEERAANGGDSGLLMRPEWGGGSGHELEYFDMQPDETRIFDVPGGCLLVRQVFYVNPPLPRFENVKEDIRGYLVQVRQAELIEALFAKASRHVTVERLYEAP